MRRRPLTRRNRLPPGACCARVWIKFSPPHQELLLAPYSGEGRVTALAEQGGKSANALYKLLGRLREKLADCIHTSLRQEAH